MKLKIPLTGRITEYHPELDGITASGGISGDLNNPIRPVPINLGNVSWKLVDIDLENDLAEIEVSPGEHISILKDGGNPDKPEDWHARPATEEEKQGFLDHARNLVEGHTKDELYTMSKKSKLIKSEEIMRKYREFQGGKKEK